MLKDNNLHNLEQKNLKTLCRLCLIDGHYLRETYGTRIPLMIQYCCNIQMLPQDQLPTHICVRCFRQIMNFYIFKRKIEKNDRTLKKITRHMPKTKDPINVASEMSEINTPELNETQEVGTKCYSLSKEIVKIIKKKNIKIRGLQESENVNFCHKSIYINEIQNLNVPLDSVANTELGTFQRQQNPLYFDYNIEPPPLVPLHFNINTESNTESILKNSQSSFLISKNLPENNIPQPPPLVPIIPVKNASDTVKEQTTCLTKLSCNICRKEFESLTVLQEHKLKSICKLNVSECNICKKNFTERKKLIVHLKGHRITREYLCNICGKRYSSQSTFRNHFRSHTGDRPFKCEICNKGFVRWAGVKNHMVTHGDFKPYECETCSKRFKVISNLYRHQRLHTGNYRYACSSCNKAFCQSDHLKLHVRTYHTNEKPYLCYKCGKGFVNSQRLKRHELVHSGQKPFPCTLCLRAYSNAIDLKNHNLRVHNKSENREEIKKYPCSVCGSRFRHPCRLTKHMKIHAELNKNCQTCGHIFKCVQSLTRHLKTSNCKKVIMETQPVLN